MTDLAAKKPFSWRAFRREMAVFVVMAIVVKVLNRHGAPDAMTVLGGVAVRGADLLLQHVQTCRGAGENPWGDQTANRFVQGLLQPLAMAAGWSMLWGVPL